MNIETNTWIHPQTKEERHYINNWPQLCGFELTYYNTGNLSTAHLDGEHLSNSLAKDTLTARVWYTNDGQIHVQHRGRTAMLPATIIELLRPHVDAELEADKLAEEKKQAEKEAEQNLPVGEVQLLPRDENGKLKAKYNTGEQILHIHIGETSTRTNIYVYDREQKPWMIHVPIASKSCLGKLQGEELKAFIKQIIDEI